MKIMSISLLLIASQCCFANLVLHAEGDPNLYHRPSRFCGVVSLYYALNEIGYKVSVDDLLTNITTEKTGASLGEMCRYLDKCNVAYRIVMTEKIETLLGLIEAHKRVLIVHADQGSHYFTVKVNEWGELYILDGRRAILDDQAKVIKQRYSNVALLIGEEAKAVTFLLDKRVRLALLAIVFTIGLLIGSLWVRATKNKEWRLTMRRVRKLILVMCLVVFTGTLFAGASFTGVSTCMSWDVDDVSGSANDKKCKKEEACDGTTSCTDEEDGVDCGSKGTKWACETATTKCCVPYSNGPVSGWEYRCNEEQCEETTISKDCGTHDRDCRNYP
jgi:hypothetical protein